MLDGIFGDAVFTDGEERKGYVLLSRKGITTGVREKVDFIRSIIS